MLNESKIIRKYKIYDYEGNKKAWHMYGYKRKLIRMRDKGTFANYYTEEQYWNQSYEELKDIL